MRRGCTRAVDPHDRLFRFVFCRPAAIAIVLRRVLPRELLACLDLRSLRSVPTALVSPRLRTRWPDLCFAVHAIDGPRRVLVYVLVEHQSRRESRMPWRALVCSGELWDRHIRTHPSRRRKLPLVFPLVCGQRPARNTPVRLSSILDVPTRLRGVLDMPIELTLHADDFSGSVLGDRRASPATRALVELARALLHAYQDPASIGRERMTALAKQVDVLLKHNRPDDVNALWVYVISVFESGSPLRTMLVKAISQPAKEMYMTIAEELLAKGQKKGERIGVKIGEAKGEARGRAKARAEAVLGVLEHRGLAITVTLRRRVLACRDELALQRWFDRAFTVASAKELLAPEPAPSRRRSSASTARTGGARAGRRLAAA